MTNEILKEWQAMIKECNIAVKECQPIDWYEKQYQKIDDWLNEKLTEFEKKSKGDGETNMLAKVALFIQENFGKNADIVHQDLIDYLKKYDK